MVSQHEMDIRLTHDQTQHFNAAITVPVDHIAQHIEFIIIGETGIRKETQEFVLRETLINSEGSSAVPFAHSVNRKNLDLPPVNLRFSRSHLAQNPLASEPTSFNQCFPKFKTMHFQHLFRHFCVVEPRFTSSKPSVLRLELTENLLETAHSSF